MSRWRRVVRRELARYREQTGFDVVERQAFLDQSLPVLREEFPENSYPGQKVSQVLQQLRDHGEVEFRGSGTYRAVALDADRRLHVAPDCETEADVLRRTLLGGMATACRCPGRRRSPVTCSPSATTDSTGGRVERTVLRLFDRHLEREVAEAVARGVAGRHG
jgi:hypothetical protein